jgi:hypothetical protein
MTDPQRDSAGQLFRPTPRRVRADLPFSNLPELEKGGSGQVGADEVFVPSHHPHPLGTPVAVELFLSTGDLALKFLGHVTWRQLPGHTPAGEEPGMGIHIDEVPEKHQGLHRRITLRGKRDGRNPKPGARFLPFTPPPRRAVVTRLLPRNAGWPRRDQGVMDLDDDSLVRFRMEKGGRVTDEAARPLFGPDEEPAEEKSENGSSGAANDPAGAAAEPADDVFASTGEHGTLAPGDIEQDDSLDAFFSGAPQQEDEAPRASAAEAKSTPPEKSELEQNAPVKIPTPPLEKQAPAPPPEEKSQAPAPVSAVEAIPPPTAEEKAPLPGGLKKALGIGLPGGRVHHLFPAGTPLPQTLSRHLPVRVKGGVYDLHFYEGDGEKIHACQPMGVIRFVSNRVKDGSLKIHLSLSADEQGKVEVQVLDEEGKDSVKGLAFLSRHPRHGEIEILERTEPGLFGRTKVTRGG